MSAQYLRGTILLLVGAVLLTVWLGPMTLFLPMIGVIQDLSSGVKNPSVHPGSGTLAIAVSIAGLFASLASVVLIARGTALDRARRWMWVFLLVIGVVTLLFASVLAFAVPRFMMLYKDLKS